MLQVGPRSPVDGHMATCRLVTWKTLLEETRKTSPMKRCLDLSHNVNVCMGAGVPAARARAAGARYENTVKMNLVKDCEYQ